MAIEDQRFYQHGGVDPEGILRAALKDLEAGKAVEGGSTITQQLVRNLCIRRICAQPRTQDRRSEAGDRVRPATLQARNPRPVPEHRLLRDDRRQHRGRGPGRLEDLLLQAGMGARLEQAALLAGLPQAPSEYNPMLNPRRRSGTPQRGPGEDGEARLRLPGRAARAERRGLELDLSHGYFQHRQPYFFDYVENKLIERYGVSDGAQRAG